MELDLEGHVYGGVTIKKSVFLHTSFQSKAESCGADLFPTSKARGHVLDAENKVSTAARHTSVTKVADKAVRQVRSRRGLIGAAASPDPFQFFILFVGVVTVEDFLRKASHYKRN